MSVVTRVKNGLFRQTKPRNQHSLENLKYLYGVIQRNPTISDANRDELVESLRSISEILIWGDQNDSSVFDFFLEKNMLTFFLNYMGQKYGRYICVQILQTLNILFENIRNETSLYYLLSNNHVNNIIVHKFDFNDEEITAYYISFLKTLSFKLNSHSINFFYNERNQDFPLYVEAIKFFDHSEAMVRIAVRTSTLNIYKVTDPGMHRFILDRTATEFFSNLVWFIRSHVLEYDKLIQNNRDINNRGRLSSGLEEYLDDIHYLEDIFLTKVEQLNYVLREQLMNRLLIPIYVFSLLKREKRENQPVLDQSSAFFLLAEIFLVIDYQPVIEELIDMILSADVGTVDTIQHRYDQEKAYSLPPPSLEACLVKPNTAQLKTNIDLTLNALDISNDKQSLSHENSPVPSRSVSSSPRPSTPQIQEQSTVDFNLKLPPLYISNWNEDEKQRRKSNPIRFDNTHLSQRPLFQSIIEALTCTDNDQQCFYALSILLTLTTNSAVDSLILESACLTVKSSDKSFYNTILVDQLCSILLASTTPDSNIRLITLNLTINLLKKLVFNEEEKKSYISDYHLARLEQACEQSAQDLRRYYRQPELFLDLFEDEYRQMQSTSIRLDYLLKDACMLCTPTRNPSIGIEFLKRLPADEIEKTRRAIRVFFYLRSLSHELRLQIDSDLPLTQPDTLVKENDKLDLSNSDLIACTVHMKETRDRRFLVVGPMQFILVEPDMKIAACGIVKFCDFMQDVEVTNVKDDTRSLQITFQKHGSKTYGKSNQSVLNAKFSFDDHIRCMSAKQNLTKGRQKVRQMKLAKIAAILDIPLNNTTNIGNQVNFLPTTPTTYSQHQFGFSTPTLSNHPGRAALISGPKRQPTPATNRLLSASSATTTASSPSFTNVEQTRRFPLSRTQSEQTETNETNTTSNSEQTREESTTNAESIAPKSLREWHEKPVDLSEQPPLNDKVNVQILSPNSERTNARFFVDNDLATLVTSDETSNECISTTIEHKPSPSDETN